jgi:hypothetical protein
MRLLRFVPCPRFVYRQDRVILLYAHARAGKLSEPSNRQARRSENHGLAGSHDRETWSKGTEMSPEGQNLIRTCEQMRLASSPSTRRYRKESRRWSPDHRRQEGGHLWYSLAT